MKCRILVAIFLLLPFVVPAQQADTFYFDKKWLSCEAAEAAYLRTFTKEGGKYKVEAHTTSGKLLMIGHVSTVKWNNRKTYENQRNGKFVYYAANGQKIKEGVYENGVSTGKWLLYFPGDDKRVEENYYTDGGLDSSKSIDKETGHLLYATYMGRSDGIKGSINFEYYASGKVKKMYFNDGKKTNTQCMDENEAVIPCDTVSKVSDGSFVDELPVPPFSIARFLSENVTYPESARATNKQGRAMISFVVMEDGTLAAIKPVNTVSPEIDEEAMRVIALMPKWKPGIQNGKVVKVSYTQPMNFKLQ